MTPYFQDKTLTIYQGDNRDALPLLPDNYVHAVVTDPPYELGFMGKHWDKSGIAYNVELWRECLRVLRPGGHLLAFGGSRTYHRLACAIEDAGFEIRDQIQWIYGSGFPKSQDIGKAIDRAAGAERRVVGKRKWTNAKMDAGKGVSGLRQAGGHAGEYDGTRIQCAITAPATEAAQQWNGWGSALKPAHEPIVVARKPLDGTLAANTLKWGCGGLNVDGCRTEGGAKKWETPRGGIWSTDSEARASLIDNPLGRWPANIIHDGSDEVVRAFPESNGGTFTQKTRQRNKGWCNSSPGDGVDAIDNYGDSGSAARYFYTAKASRSERDGSKHPTVKPLALMVYLVKLVTPEGGIVLDLFAGTGTTAEAAEKNGCRVILVERELESCRDIEKRLRQQVLPMFAPEPDAQPPAQKGK